MNALKLIWIRKLKKYEVKWKQGACEVYQNMDDIDLYGPSIYSKVDHSNRFGKDTFKVYELFGYIAKPETPEETLAEPLFLNENIKIGRKCIVFKSWIQKGSHCIGPMIDEEKLFYKHNDFTKKKSNIQVSFLDYFGCVQAIKAYMMSLKITRDANQIVITPRSLAEIYAQVKGTKSYYDISIENGKGPNCCNKWEIKSGGEIDWKACFTETKKI